MDYVADFVKASATLSIPNPLPSHTGHHHPHHSHPSHGHQHGDVHFAAATKTGEKTLVVVGWLFIIGFTVATLGALRVEKKSRLFHILTASVLGCAMISYLAMASGHGVHMVATYAEATKHAAAGTIVRQVYYARYIDWLFTTPLLLVSLAFLAGLSALDTAVLILLDVGMIVTGLLGGLQKAVSKETITSRWTFYTISCVFFLALLYILGTSGLKAANLRPSKTRGLFYLLGGMTAVLWTAYPIVWALTEGAGVISVDKEIIAYGILDVAAKLGFGFILLAVHSGSSEDDYTMPDWVVTPRNGAEGGRGGYGSIRVGDD